MSETRTDWTSAKQRQFTRENIARYPDAPFPYSAVLDLLDALDAALATPPTDADKLRLLAAWFDMWDRPETDRQAILNDPRNPGRNDVQRDLRRIAAALAASEPPSNPERGELRAMLAYAYANGHNDGIGCGHDLSPACRHDPENEIAEEIRYGLASPIRHWFAARLTDTAPETTE